MQWALLRLHCHHGLIHAGTGWVLAAIRALPLFQISKNANSSVSRRAESTWCGHLDTEVWRDLFSFSIKNWRLLPMSKTVVFWAWVAHGPFQAATTFGCNQYWLWVAYIHFWKLLYSRSFQTYWVISAVPPRPHFRFCWVPHLKKSGGPILKTYHKTHLCMYLAFHLNNHIDNSSYKMTLAARHLVLEYNYILPSKCFCFYPIVMNKEIN